MRPRIAEFLLGGLLACLAMPCGCLKPTPPVPCNTAEYNQLEQTNPRLYTGQTIVLRNLTRVLDKSLPMEERIASLELLRDPRLKDVEQPAMRELSTLGSEQGAPDELVRLAEEVLASRGLSGRIAIRKGATPPVPPGPVPPAPKPPGPKPPGPVRPTPPEPSPPKPVGPPDLELLAGRVKRWAQDPTNTLESEQQYRQAIRQMTGKEWDAALWELINTPGFLARGSALEVLNQRVPRKQLTRMISSVTQPRTDAMAALGVFLRRLGYIPANGTEFMAATLLYKTREDMIREAAKYSEKWNTEYGYEFNVRDFHLLSRLALDPLQEELRRIDLILRLGKALSGRPHAAARSGNGGARIDDHFDQQVEKLKMPDLWNLWLLNGMLEREQVQMALRATAAGDRDDRQHAWGGLVFYANGRAEARRYSSGLAVGGRANDLIYVPSTRAVLDSFDALCRFHCHFEKANNQKRAGPTPEELRQGKEDNVHGLVLTSISKDVFCAHYYNPSGVVVSLGMFPFRQ